MRIINGSMEQSNALGQWQTGQVFATLRPGNDTTKQSMNYMGQNKANLSDHHRRYLNLKCKARDDLPIDAGSRYRPPVKTLAGIARKDIFEGGWDLAYDHRYKAHGRCHLGLYLGEGSDHKGPTRDVDLLIRFPGRPIKAPRVALLRVHPRSGILMIESLQKHIEVQYILDNEPVILEVGKVHCFWQTTNLFAVDGFKFVLKYSRLEQRELDIIRKERDEVWNLRGLPAPDSRFPIIPPNNPLKRLDDGTIVLRNIARGSFGIVGIGLNIKTGEPCAVKSVPIRNVGVLRECMNEADILFKFPSKVGLLQASHLVCDHGTSFHAGQTGEVRAVFGNCKGADVLYFVLPLATGDFDTINIHKADFEATVRQMRGPLQGLKTLHDDGYIHCDVTVSNMFIIAKDEGVLGDYGKAIKALRHNSNKIGPSFTLAPEINGVTSYDRSIDVWACGFAFAEILLPDLFKWKSFNKHGSQNRDWIIKACRSLDIFGQQSALHKKVAEIVKKVLAFEPGDRPTIESVLEQWPVVQQGHDRSSNEDGIKKGSGDEDPPAKTMKAAENTKNARI